MTVPKAGLNIGRGIGVGDRTPISPQKFYLSIPKDTRWLRIFGVTMDSSSNPLGNCTVKLYDSLFDIELQTTVSDGSGNYSFTLKQLTADSFYIVAYLPGSPDVAGTTVNTLVGA